MKVAITGNSHVGALASAKSQTGLDATVFALGTGRYETDVFSEVRSDGVGFTAEPYAETLLRHTGRTIVDDTITWGFLQVNHNARIYRHTTWLTHEPAAVAGAGTFPVSQALLRTVIERDHLGVRQFFEHLRTAGVTFFAVSAPPPRRDHPAVQKGVRLETIRHIDSMARDIWSGWLSERDIDLVGPPSEAFDHEGFLASEFESQRVRQGQRDRHHASDEYGELLMGEVARHLSP